MEKFKNLSKGKKAGVYAIGLAVLVALGAGAGLLLGNKTKDAVISKENLAGLTTTNYTVEALNESKDGKKLEVAIKGDFAEKDLEDLAKALKEKHAVAKWKSEEIAVNVFAKDSKTTEKSDFFVEGLTNRIVVNVEKAKADISSYSNVPAVEKTDALVDYSKGEVQANDGNVILTLDMDVAKDEEKIVDVVQQLKTFAILFRETNSDKEIKSVELHVNPNDNELKYNFNTNFENILEVINVLPL